MISQSNTITSAITILDTQSSCRRSPSPIITITNETDITAATTTDKQCLASQSHIITTTAATTAIAAIICNPPETSKTALRFEIIKIQNHHRYLGLAYLLPWSAYGEIPYTVSAPWAGVWGKA